MTPLGAISAPPVTGGANAIAIQVDLGAHPLDRRTITPAARWNGSHASKAPTARTPANFVHKGAAQ